MVRIDDYRIFLKKSFFRKRIVYFWLKVPRINLYKVETIIFELLSPNVEYALRRKKSYITFLAKCNVGHREPREIERQFFEIIQRLLRDENE